MNLHNHVSHDEKEMRHKRQISSYASSSLTAVSQPTTSRDWPHHPPPVKMVRKEEVSDG